MRVLGLDLGTRTLGIAMSDPSLFLASPLVTLRFAEGDYEDALTTTGCTSPRVTVSKRFVWGILSI
jgi:RNase H-fold protein (predicted Holliday junction resolvase)